MSAQEKKQTLDQQRAEHAWNAVSAVASLPSSKENDAIKKEFGTQAKKLPTRIMAAGLGQALAFLEAKNYAEGLRTALTAWMHRRRPGDSGKPLFVRVIESDADFLRYATAECLAYLAWLVRWCDAKKLTGED